MNEAKQYKWAQQLRISTGGRQTIYKRSRGVEPENTENKSSTLNLVPRVSIVVDKRETLGMRLQHSYPTRLCCLPAPDVKVAMLDGAKG